jgi:hypothetical protein
MRNRAGWWTLCNTRGLASVELVKMFDSVSKQDRYIMVLHPGWIRGRHSFTLASEPVL